MNKFIFIVLTKLLTTIPIFVMGQDINCKDKEFALLLDYLSGWDSLHNCTLNVSSQFVKDSKTKDLLKTYRLFVQDDYSCRSNKTNCPFELIELTINNECLSENIQSDNLAPILGDLNYTRTYEQDSSWITIFARVKLDPYNNLVFLSLGEISNLPAHNHRVVCQPKLFGGSK